MSFLNFLRPIKKTNYTSIHNKKIEVIVRYKDKKIIYVQGAEQTGGTITGMWQKAFSRLPKTRDKRLSALLLGLGGGDVVRLIHKINPQAFISAVELDPVMIKIAGDFFNLRDSDKLKIYQRDAFYFLLLNRETYDLIIVDLFIGFKNPQKFRELRFLNMLKKHISEDGFIVYNSHYHSDLNNVFEEFHTLCCKIFTKVEILISYPYSRILLLKP